MDMQPIVFDRVRRTYPGGIVALDEMTLEVRRGEILALLGPNGAGKTTAVRMMLGLARHDSGNVSVFGSAPGTLATRQRIGAMLQIGKVPETLTVREHVRLFRTYYPYPLPEREIVEAAGLEGLEKKLFGRLSGGEQQRLLFALAICGRPDLLLLDEPTVGLDVAARGRMRDAVRAIHDAGNTILLTTHDMDEADALADRIAVVDHGRVVALGTPAEIRNVIAGRRIVVRTCLDPASVSIVPGVAAVHRSPDGRLVIHTSAIERVLRELFSRDARLTDLELPETRLEEAFLTITGERRGAA